MYTNTSLTELIKSDLERQRMRFTLFNIFICSFLKPYCSILIWYRVTNFFFQKKGFINAIAFKTSKLFLRHFQYKTGIQIPYSVQVGRGIRFMHYNSIVISSISTIGDYCTIFNDVTIGQSYSFKYKGAPKIGNNVVIFTGAKIIGNITIGNNVIIGANSVVIRDVPDNCVVAGIPAKVISKETNNVFYKDEDKMLYHFY